MKKFRKHVSLLLAIAMLVSLFVASTATTVSATHGDLLVDLDLSTYVKDTTTSTSSNPTVNIGNVTNNGSLASTTQVVMASDSASYTNDLDLESFWNQNGEQTYYLDFSQSKSNITSNNRKRFIDEPALESTANTISMWIKYAPADNDPTQQRYRCIMSYSVNGTNLFTLRADRTTSNNFILCDGYNYTWRVTRNDANDVWSNLVLTNPEYVNGEKVMKAYLNGTLLGSTTVTQPSGAVTTAKICIAGQNPYPNDTVQIPMHMAFGEVKVYEGELSASEIQDIYDDNAYKFIEGQEPQANNVEGYSLSNASFDYDEQSHSLAVVAGQDATEDVTVTYTCGGEEFTGATEVGTYNITATVSKEGYNSQVLNATLTINAVTLPSKLVDLDVSTFSCDKITDPDGTASVGSVTNTGSLASSSIVVMSALERYNLNLLDKETFINQAGGDTPYLRLEQTSDTCWDENKYRYVEENALETRANTISFWVKYDPDVESNTTRARSIFDYAVEYDNDRPDHLFEIIRAEESTGEGFKVRSRWADNPKVDIAADATDKWVNFVITNPEYATEDGGVTYTKTMTAYLNGRELYSRTITKPAGAVTSAKIAFAGQTLPGYYNAQQDAFINRGIDWPAEIGFADIDVYDGVLTPAQILAVKRADQAKYIERVFDPGEASKLIDFDLTNFALSRTQGSGGIVNTGSSNTATISAYTGAPRSSGKTAFLSADYLYSKDDLSPVKKIVRLHHEYPESVAGGAGDYLNRTFDVEDLAMGSQAFSLSFWVNVDTISKQTAAGLPIVHYEIGRSDSGRTAARLWQYSLDTSNDYKWCVGWSSGPTATSLNNSHEWHHVVMTVPEFVNGSAVVHTYIDGHYKPTLDQELDIEEASVTSAKIYFGKIPGGLNGQYICPGDISYGDIVVYSSVLIPQDIEQLYDSQKDTYLDSAYNKITVKNSSDNTIRDISNVADGEVITVYYDENITPGTQIFAATYTSDEMLLSSNTAVMNGTGSITLTVPADATRVRIFTLKDGYAPIQKIGQLLR